MRRLLPVFLLVLALGFFLVQLKDFFPRAAKKESLHLSQLPTKASKEPSFVFLVSALNPGKFYRKTLESIFEQSYTRLRVLYLDLGSTDGSFEQAKEFSADPRVEFLQTEEEGLTFCKDEEIVLFLRAGDWLAHEEVLDQLSRAYEKEGVLAIRAGSREYPSYRQAKEALHSGYGFWFKGERDKAGTHETLFPYTLSIQKAPARSIEEFLEETR